MALNCRQVVYSLVTTESLFMSYDHVHCSIKDKGVPYEFENAQQLLNDFLNEVNSILSKLNNGGN